MKKKILKPESFDIKKARDFINKKYNARAKKHKLLFKKAWREFNAIIKMITEKYRPKRIYQWGSLLNEGNFLEISDIDIAVEGIKSPADFFAMYGDALKLSSFPLDIVQIEKIDAIHAKNIRKKGKIIYEKK